MRSYIPFQISETHFSNMEYAYTTIEKRIFQIFETIYYILFFSLSLLTEFFWARILSREQSHKISLKTRTKKKRLYRIDIASFTFLLIKREKLPLKDKHLHKRRTLCKALDQLNTYRPLRLLLLDTHQYMYRMQCSRLKLRKPLCSFIFMLVLILKRYFAWFLSACKNRTFFANNKQNTISFPLFGKRLISLFSWKRKETLRKGNNRYW